MTTLRLHCAHLYINMADWMLFCHSQEYKAMNLNLNSNKKNSLTTRQRAIYDFIKDKILNRGYGPTVREIGEGFKIRSPNGVMCHLKALEKKGLITREAHMSRAIQISEPLSKMTLPL